MAITERRKRFIDRYLIHLNGTKAAIEAGYSKKTAKKIASNMLAMPDIKKAIAQAIEKRSERVEITQDYVLTSLREVAERCMQRSPVMEGQGKDRQQATDADGNHIWQFDAAGANRSLELLGKHLKMFTDKFDLSSSDGTMTPRTLSDFYAGRPADAESGTS